MRKATIRTLEEAQRVEKMLVREKMHVLRGNESNVSLVAVLKSPKSLFLPPHPLKSSEKLCWLLLFGLRVVFRMATTRPPFTTLQSHREQIRSLPNTSSSPDLLVTSILKV